jgi:hypothetical protein
VGATDLTLDLFTGPTCSLDGSGREFAVLACVLDHCSEPLLAVEVLEFAVGESICKVTVAVSLILDKESIKNLPNDTH